VRLITDFDLYHKAFIEKKNSIKISKLRRKRKTFTQITVISPEKKRHAHTEFMHNNHLTFYDCTTIIEFGRDVD
jgi:hypothetical protein